MSQNQTIRSFTCTGSDDRRRLSTGRAADGFTARGCCLNHDGVSPSNSSVRLCAGPNERALQDSVSDQRHRGRACQSQSARPVFDASLHMTWIKILSGHRPISRHCSASEARTQSSARYRSSLGSGRPSMADRYTDGRPGCAGQIWRPMYLNDPILFRSHGCRSPCAGVAQKGSSRFRRTATAREGIESGDRPTDAQPRAYPGGEAAHEWF